MTFPLELAGLLAEWVPASATGLVVGLSGGGDSAALLTALVHPDALRGRGLPLRAVHVDHGLQSAAAALRTGCEALCERLGIPLAVISVSVAAGPGISLEEAAREARYAGFARAMSAGECLLTAHHAEDQAETLLLQLLRGAGPKGLSAMPGCREFAAGWHVRPLLDVTQRQLREYAAAAGIEGVRDPMNSEPRFDRVYLRERLWPLLTGRWPGVARTLGRTARHCADAQQMLDRYAADALPTLRDGNSLSVQGLRRLAAAAQSNVLRHWIGEQAVQPPPMARLAEALRQAFESNADHLPMIAWGGWALRRYQNRLFLTPADPPRLGDSLDWDIAAGSRLVLGPGLGMLEWCVQPGGLDGARLPGTLVVRRRCGGESLKPGAGARTRSLQHLCQSFGILPWMRDALPLVFADGHLIAVGDLWQDARWCVPAGTPGYGCVWQNAPDLVT